MHALRQGKAPYWGYDNFVIELGKFSDSKDHTARAMLSDYTKDHLASLAILISCRTETQQYTHILPRAFPNYQTYIVMCRNVTLESALRRCHVHLAPNPKMMATDRLFNGGFTYPAHLPRTQANVEMMRTAEKNLDVFWETLTSELMKTNEMPPELQDVFDSRSNARVAASCLPADGTPPEQP